MRKTRLKNDPPCIRVRQPKMPIKKKKHIPRKPHRYCHITGKAMFEYEQADAIARRLLKKHITTRKLGVYKCFLCDAYHLTKKPQR